jgi:hypothetical protein
VKRAIFLTVLHRLFVSGLDRSCDRWHRDYVIDGIDALSLHQLYRAMALLGEELEDQKDCAPFAPRCTKDVIEEDLFPARPDEKEQRGEGGGSLPCRSIPGGSSGGRLSQRPFPSEG